MLGLTFIGFIICYIVEVIQDRKNRIETCKNRVDCKKFGNNYQDNDDCDQTISIKKCKCRRVF